ncbi:MAG: YabP/YqfC family sporulation protein [Clostridia bacterium]|nr:YabP/YqfC family sporulation protein [Clostridia bacterium]
MRIPSIRLYGKRKAQILTHKGIKSCSDRHIEIFSVAGVICVCGRQLEITEINDEYLCVKGVIESISYKT